MCRGNVRGDDPQRFLSVGKGEKVVEVGPIDRAPREVLRNKKWIDTGGEGAKAPQVISVEPLRASKGEAYAMEADRIVAPNGIERCHRGAAAEIVFGVDFEPSDFRSLSQHFVQMRRPEADADARVEV